LDRKSRKNVISVMSAAAAIRATVVSSNPCRSNRSSAQARIRLSPFARVVAAGSKGFFRCRTFELFEIFGTTRMAGRWTEES